jgi:hypothetical protein
LAPGLGGRAKKLSLDLCSRRPQHERRVGINSNAPTLKQWAQAYWKAVHPFNLPGAYPNFMMDDEGEARVKAGYGQNYDRLASLKKKYDTANLFRVNQNIKPAA